MRWLFKHSNREEMTKIGDRLVELGYQWRDTWVHSGVGVKGQLNCIYGWGTSYLKVQNDEIYIDYGTSKQYDIFADLNKLFNSEEYAHKDNIKMKHAFSLPLYQNKDLAALITKRAVELGYKPSGDNHQIRVNNALKEVDGRLVFTSVNKGINWNQTVSSYHPDASLQEFLTTDKYKIPTKLPIKVLLNSEYTAEVTDEVVKVGCQQFPVSKLTELVKAVEDYKK